MAQDASGNIYELHVIYETRERAYRSRLWYEQTGSVGNDIPATALCKGIVNATIPDLFAAIMSNTNRVIAVEAFLRATSGGPGGLQTENGPPGRADFTPISGGRSGGNALPDNCCLVMRWGQISGGARNNGKCFISGIDEDDTTAGVLNDSARQSFETSFSVPWPIGDIFGNPGGTFRQVVMSKPRDENGNPVGWQHPIYGSPLDVTSVSFNVILYTQRRRTTRFEGRQ